MESSKANCQEHFGFRQRLSTQTLSKTCKKCRAKKTSLPILDRLECSVTNRSREDIKTMTTI
uniref:Uncharacterized protein n=1 Tax=Manihot esculenta TaxID=3983 RepID=A0A2C9V652_MANES